MASETGYTKSELDRKRKTGEGLLATPPDSSKIYMPPSRYLSYQHKKPDIKSRQSLATAPRYITSTSPIPPRFISGTYHPGSISNKMKHIDTYEAVKSTFLSYIQSSIDSRKGTINIYKLTSSILFSCFNNLLSTLVGSITQMLQTSSDKEYIPLIVGGMALRFYNQSYITSDLDVKIYPLHIDESFTDVSYLETVVKPQFKSKMEELFTPANIHHFLSRYITNYIFPFYNDPELLEVYKIGTELMEQIKTNSIHFELDYPNIYGTSEKNKSVLKIGCRIGKGDASSFYKVMDISVYNPNDEAYASLIRKFYDENPTIVTPYNKYIPPVNLYTIGGLPYYIVGLNFIDFEKKELTSKYEEEEGEEGFHTTKFKRAMSGLDNPTSQPYTFLGGKSKKKHRKNKKKTKRIRRKQNKKKHNTHKRKHNRSKRRSNKKR